MLLVQFALVCLCAAPRILGQTLSLFSSQQNCSTLSLLPGSAANFSTAYLYALPNQRFSTKNLPDAIIYPKSSDEVRFSVSCIRAAGYTLRVRSGGHSYEALSSTADSPFIILDLRDVSSISVDVANKKAIAGAGATLGELYYAIAKASPTLSFPGGTCPTVGLGGLISGGGEGNLARKYGLAIDHVLSIQIVLANSTLVTSDPTTNSDLFWALRGGGGGNFGVVVQYTLSLVDVPAVVTYGSLGTSITNGEVFLAQYQTWLQNASLDVAADVTLDASIISLEFSFLGSRNDAIAALKEFTLVSALVTTSNLKEGAYLDSVIHFSYFPGTANAESLLSRYATDRVPFYASSDFVSTPFSTAGISTLISAVKNGYTSGQQYVIVIGYAKGQATIPATSDTAFYHRKVLFCLEYQALYTSPSAASLAQTWLTNLQTSMAQFVTGGAYVNYINLNFGSDIPIASKSQTVPNPPSWAKRYFGDNWSRLAFIKANVDPLDVFSGPQSIPVVVKTSEVGSTVGNTGSGSGSSGGSGNTTTTTGSKSGNDRMIHLYLDFAIMLAVTYLGLY
ncbi:hypothetical protein HK096_004122, partial [Nowakowskiella sp. JEL0078]